MARGSTSTSKNKLIGCKKIFIGAKKNADQKIKLVFCKGRKFLPLHPNAKTKKIFCEKKQKLENPNKKIQNPEWRTNARLCFASLAGGLIKFFGDCYVEYWLWVWVPPKAMTPSKNLASGVMKIEKTNRPFTLKFSKCALIRCKATALCRKRQQVIKP